MSRYLLSVRREQGPKRYLRHYNGVATILKHKGQTTGRKANYQPIGIDCHQPDMRQANFLTALQLFGIPARWFDNEKGPGHPVGSDCDVAPKNQLTMLCILLS